MNVSQALQLATQRLQPQSAKTDAEYLLSQILEKNFTWLKTWPDYQLTPEQEKQYLALLVRREQGEPIAYITGERGFWTLNLKTNSSTLIPRTETELLVELAIDLLKHSSQSRVLDLGTGTGAIALAIACELAQAEVFACDFNSDAVELAQQNASLNQISNVTIFQSNWFSNVKKNSFDLIVSNPPYIAPDDQHLTQGDLVFEPASALVAQDNGLADIKHIIETAVEFLKNDGYLLVEHGFEQAKQVRQIFRRSGYQNIQTVQDLSEQDRVTLARKTG